MDETTSSAENLDMVGHLPIIDRDLKLAFPSLASVHPELAGLSHNPGADVRDLNQPGVVRFEEDRAVLDLDSCDVDVHDIAANLLGVELDFEESIVLQQPEEEEKVWSEPGTNIG